MIHPKPSRLVEAVVNPVAPHQMAENPLLMIGSRAFRTGKSAERDEVFSANNGAAHRMVKPHMVLHPRINKLRLLIEDNEERGLLGWA